MRKSGAVERRDDMIDLMMDAIKEEEKYRESIRRGENNNIVRFDNNIFIFAIIKDKFTPNKYDNS